MNEPQSQHPASFPVALLLSLLIAFAIWGGFCWYATKDLSIANNEVLRFAVRFGSVLLAAIVFGILTRSGRKPTSETTATGFGLLHNVQFGVLVGLLIAGIYCGVAWKDPFQAGFSNLPTTPFEWLQKTISPIGDELFFRAVLVTQIFALSQRSDGAKGWDSWVAAIILSSAIFAIFHVPGWLVFDKLAAPQLMLELAKTFSAGIVLAICYSATRSLWASLFPHWAWALLRF